MSITIDTVPLDTVLRLNAERTISLKRYEADGYFDRFGYLKGLCEENGISWDTMMAVLAFMPPTEDFDGLVTTLEDFSAMGMID